jgi:hypothetical protein
MRIAGARVKTFAHNFAIAHNYTTNPWVGAGS